MDISQKLDELDNLFSNKEIDKVEAFIETNIELAKAEGDANAIITLLNELIGFYRDTSQFEKSLETSNQVLELMKQENLINTVHYGTTLLNVANAQRAAGRYKESMDNYNEVYRIFKNNLENDNFLYASYHNNFSLLYQEMNDFSKAADELKLALDIVEGYPDAKIEKATTCTNLANSLMKLGEYKKAMLYISKAIDIFEAEENKDFHYSGALAAMGEAKYLAGELEESEEYYQRALKEIEENVGHTKAYEIIVENLNKVHEQLHGDFKKMELVEKGMALCEAFYYEYGAPMIHEFFSEYEDQIAVGLVGEGSECFGFDDNISKDHDFGPGFCIWLTDQLYDEIGDELQKKYDELPKTYHGVTRIETVQGKHRVGVIKINDFYENITGFCEGPTTTNQWLFVEDYKLATATNGKVFRDDLGRFSGIRKSIQAYYPENVRLKKLAREIALFSQSGQYNYTRMLSRGEYVTADIALSEFMKHTMLLVYLLNCKYAPFYKWMNRGMQNLPILPEIMDILKAISDMPKRDERIPVTIEIIARLIVEELRRQEFTVESIDTYLEHYCNSILENANKIEKTMVNKIDKMNTSRIEKNENINATFKEELLEELIALEWKAFDKVDNQGGRASCQNDWATFYIMRKSQYLSWNVNMLQSFINDFRDANSRGWNLITEKYGRMMKSTAPADYARIASNFEIIPPEKQEIIEEIVAIQVSWMEEFAEKYPKSARQSRSIHTIEDTSRETSYETYLRGELETYSDTTLELYGRFIAAKAKDNENLAEEIMLNTAKLYKYNSLEEMEKSISIIPENSY